MADNDAELGLYKPTRRRKTAPEPAPDATTSAAERMVSDMLNRGELTAGQWEDWVRLNQEDQRRIADDQARRLDQIDGRLQNLQEMMEIQRHIDTSKQAGVRFVVRFIGLLLATNWIWASDVRQRWLPGIEMYWPLLAVIGIVAFAVTYLDGNGGLLYRREYEHSKGN
jgi:hypothetical protein